MAGVRERHTQGSPLIRLAPSRLPAPSGCQIGRLREGGVHDEQKFLECIRGFFQEYGQQYACQILVDGYQALPPEAVSMLDPPERAWLFHLHLVGPAWDQTTGQAEVIAALWDDEMRIILR